MLKSSDNALKIFSQFLENALERSRRSQTLSQHTTLAAQAYETWARYIQQAELNELIARGRAIGFFFADIIASALLLEDAARDEDPRAVEIAKRYVMRLQGSDPLSKFSPSSAEQYDANDIFSNGKLLFMRLMFS